MPERPPAAAVRSRERLADSAVEPDALTAPLRRSLLIAAGAAALLALLAAILAHAFAGRIARPIEALAGAAAARHAGASRPGTALREVNAVARAAALALAGDAGEVAVRLDLDSAAVEVSVADTGPGFAAELRDRLFEPFVTTKADGMGVGLSICRSIVEAHGARLEAAPRVGGGTVFRFALPTLAEMPADAA